jgi:hypothetical protein
MPGADKAYTFLTTALFVERSEMKRKKGMDTIDAARIYSAINYVIETIHQGRRPRREMLGFLDKKHLVHFDGQRIEKVTVKESVKRYFKMLQAAHNDAKADLCHSIPAEHHWLRLVVKELGV